MSSKVFSKVVSLTNRPELKEETITAIQLAVTYYHSLEAWGKDNVTAMLGSSSMTYDASKGIMSVDLSKLAPKFGDLVDGIAVNGTPYSQGAACASTPCTFTRLGDSLQFQYSAPSGCLAPVKYPSVCFSYKSLPAFDENVCDESSSSWIVRAHPEIVARYAVAYIKATLEGRNMQRQKMDEEALLRLYLGDVV